MSTGAISVRYATALLRYTNETGRSAEVCAQIEALLDNPDQIPGTLEPELAKFVELLRSRGRLDCVKMIFHSYVQLYHESEGIKAATLYTVVPAHEMAVKLKAILEQQTACRVELKEKVDPELIGGFVLELDDHMLDASVRRQIDDIRKQFIINTNRIV